MQNVVNQLAGIRGTESDAVFKTGIWDRRNWREFLKDFPNQGETALEKVGDKAGKFPGIDSLFREVFNRAFSHMEPNRLDETSPTKQWQRKIHDALDEVRQWKETKEMTRGNSLMAGALASEFASRLMSELPDPPDPPPEPETGQGGDDSGDGEMSEAQAQSQQQWQEYADGLDPSTMRQAVRNALEAAQDAAQDANAMGLMAGTDPGNPGALDMSRARKFAEAAQNNPSFKKIASMAGRLRAISQGVRSRRSQFGRSEVHGVTMGNDIARLLPVEMTKLKMGGGIAAETLSRFADSRTLQYALRGEDKEGKGPIVVMIDASGSMMAASKDGTTREEWAKAFALALLNMARKQKRAFHAAMFDSEVLQGYTIDSGKSQAPSTEEIIRLLSFSPRGGTSFDEALRHGYLISTLSGMKKSDVILITDGQSTISDYTKKLIEISDAKLISVFIDCAPTGDLKTLSSVTCRVSPDDDTEAHQVFIEV